MPRTKKKQESKPAAPQPAAAKEATSDVLTLAEAAAYLRWSEQDVMALIHTQGLPGRCIAGEWRFFKTAIQQWLATGSPTWETRKAAILAAAGSFKDDPDLLGIVEDIYRKRGRPITEDGSYNLLHGLEPESNQK